VVQATQILRISAEPANCGKEPVQSRQARTTPVCGASQRIGYPLLWSAYAWLVEQSTLAGSADQLKLFPSSYIDCPRGRSEPSPLAAQNNLRTVTMKLLHLALLLPLVAAASAAAPHAPTPLAPPAPAGAVSGDPHVVGYWIVKNIPSSTSVQFWWITTGESARTRSTVVIVIRCIRGISTGTSHNRSIHHALALLIVPDLGICHRGHRLPRVRTPRPQGDSRAAQDVVGFSTRAAVNHLQPP
jgi:hypothetical protein